MERCEVFWILLNAVKGFFDKQLEQRGIREHQRDVTLIVNPFSFPLICHAFLICLAVFRLTQGIFRLRPLSFSVWFMFGSLKSPQWMVLLAVTVPDLSHVFHCFLCACVFFLLVSHFQLTVLIGGIYWGWGHWDTGTSEAPPPHKLCQRFWNSESALLLQLVGLSIKRCHKINFFFFFTYCWPLMKCLCSANLV